MVLMNLPVLIKSLLATMPVAWAKAFGGVLIGNDIPIDAESATQITIRLMPP